MFLSLQLFLGEKQQGSVVAVGRVRSLLLGLPAPGSGQLQSLFLGFRSCGIDVEARQGLRDLLPESVEAAMVF